MKIGILTYHRAHNYGAMLQVYALKTYVEQLGYQVEIIDYWPDYHDEEYKLLPFFRNRNILGKIKAILLFSVGFIKIINRAKTYRDFIKEYLRLDDKVTYRYASDLKDIEFDVVIYGSDQIWRKENYLKNQGFSDVFYGDYPICVKRKISYAASMGIIDVSENDKVYIKEKMLNFDVISVREQSLKDMLKTVVDSPIKVVADPVFLLDKNDWNKLIPSINPLFSRKYIFFYHLLHSEEAVCLVNRLQAHYGYEVIEVCGRVKPLSFGKRFFHTAGPIDFIGLIQNAEIVVSTSFHGVAFSLIFEKQFYALGMGNNSDRVESLLKKVGIIERLSKTNGSEFDIGATIDYKDVIVRLENLRGASQLYIKENLSFVPKNESSKKNIG